MAYTFKTTLKWVLEAILVLAVVFIAFLIILALLYRIFPAGQSLFQFVKPAGETADPALKEPGSRQLQVLAGNGESLIEMKPGATAILSKMENMVKSKRASQLAWQNAVPGIVLYNRDAVQTFQKSTARLRLEGGHYLDLHENSLVIMRKIEKDVFIRHNKAVVVLMDGELTGEVTRSSSESFDLEVVAPAAVASISADTGSGEIARFRLAVDEDESSILTVLEGTANLVTEEGSIEVGTDQIVKVTPGKAPVYLMPPPGPPALRSPDDGAIYAFRDMAPMVTFRWAAGSSSPAFHFMLSSDPEFNTLIHDDSITDNKFSHGNLKPGSYFWRVSSISDGQEGRFSPIRMFTLHQDFEPPPLDISIPESPVKSGMLKLIGRTEPGAQVFVSGIPVSTDSTGRFTYDHILQPGSNVIVVEAVDEVGNVGYFSRIVNAEF